VQKYFTQHKIIVVVPPLLLGNKGGTLGE